MRHLFCLFVFVLIGLFLARAGSVSILSPVSLAEAKEGQTLYVAGYTANQVLKVDLTTHKAESLSLPLPPSGLAMSADGLRLYVTCAGVQSQVAVVDAAAWRVIGALPAGHTATAPVLSADGQTLYVCNQFNNDISVFDLTVTNGLAPGREVCRIPISREPVAADLTKDGRYLLVANFLPAGRADAEHVAAVVSVIDTATRRMVKELALPNGSGSLHDLRVSPDGRYAAVTHLLASFNRATTKVQTGWMNANALTLIDLGRLESFLLDEPNSQARRLCHYGEIGASFLLDEPNRGAANPWGVAWSADGKKPCCRHPAGRTDFQKTSNNHPPPEVAAAKS